MKCIENDKVVFFDVDDTLIIWTTPLDEKSENAPQYRVSHKHVNELKRQSTRGYHVVVWSGSGYKWANEIVTKLGIEEYVDTVMGKPTYYYDDLPADKFLIRRYLE